MSRARPQIPPPGQRGCIFAVLLAISALAALFGLRRPAAEGVPADPRSLAAGHELRDLTLRQAVMALGLLIGAVLVMAIAVTGFEALVLGPNGHFWPITAIVDDKPNVQPPPAPQLETANGQVLEELHTKEDALLNHYTWIDQKAGTVRIPIDRAMELVLQRGLPVQSGPAGAAAGHLTRPESSSSGRMQEGTIP
jgi:hypothetical protein